jgi:hypothetical protein
MRFETAAALAILLVLAGCSKPASTGALSPTTYVDEKSRASSTATAPAAGAMVAPTLAYAYHVSVVAPAARIAELVGRQQDACTAAGPTVCQVTGSSLEALGRDDVHASLTLRGAPAWLNAFRTRIGAEAETVGGKIGSATVTSEDLSTRVIDTTAAIKAKTALRDRLEKLLEARPGKASDFLEVATDLARVQGELDATTSELAAMRQRLDTSTLTIDYASSSLLGGDGAWAPLARAIRGSTGVFGGALALMVTVAAAVLPWGLVIGGGAWVTFAVRRRLGLRRPRPMPAEPTG